jgi:cysteine desulfurase family protein (TIGR01976 family)
MLFDKIRDNFPALSNEVNGYPVIYLDGPAGTQVPNQVIEAQSQYYKNCNANSHGFFQSSRETDKIIDQTRQNVAALLGAEGPETISFGQNMTSLNFKLSRAFGRFLQNDDEIIITQLDHEANRGPWLSLRSEGIRVKEVRIKKDGTLDYNHLEALMNDRTRLVAVGYASNIFGTVNDIAFIRELTYQYGALLIVDAVHYAPHFPIDAQADGIDLLLCSAYKFYGPHVGILYAKPGILDQLPTDRLRTQNQQAPYKIETGTLNHAALAGVGAALDFIASFSEEKDYRAKIVNTLNIFHQHEIKLAQELYEGLQSFPDVQVYGPGFDTNMRAPTLAFTIRNQRPEAICQALGKDGIFAWDGHFYAIRAVEVMDLLEEGGVTRMGLVAYNTKEEIERTLLTVEQLTYLAQKSKG